VQDCAGSDRMTLIDEKKSYEDILSRIVFLKILNAVNKYSFGVTNHYLS
jgi:hypothetical protein